MCFRRNPWLGHYHATREEWYAAYQYARILRRFGFQVDPAIDGVRWKAGLIVDHEKFNFNDPLTVPLRARLDSKRYIDSILKEENV